jgi:hypothetical protein
MGLGNSYTPPEKTVELVIYVSYRLKDKHTYGSTLLNKSLCLIDCMSYLRTGKPITDLKYIRQKFGPIPEPRKFLSIRDNLINGGELEKITTTYFGKTQHKYIAKREPKVDIFEKEEIFLIDEVIDSLCDQTATEISDYTHEFISWKFADQDEELPLYTFLLGRTEPELKDYDWALASAQKYLDNQKAS